MKKLLENLYLFIIGLFFLSCIIMPFWIVLQLWEIDNNGHEFHFTIYQFAVTLIGSFLIAFGCYWLVNKTKKDEGNEKAAGISLVIFIVMILLHYDIESKKLSPKEKELIETIDLTE